MVLIGYRYVRFKVLDFEELIKLPSTISKKIDYLKFVSKNYSKSIAISTGMTDQDYEDWLLKSFKNNDKLYLMQCNSAFNPSRTY